MTGSSNQASSSTNDTGNTALLGNSNQNHPISPWLYSYAQRISNITGENVWDVIGSISTLLAMIPQGGFGMLLMDYLFFQTLPLPARIPLDVIFFIGSEEGKRQLIRFFNTNSFKNLAKKEWLKDLDPRKLTPQGVLNALMTIIASATFGGLAIMGNRGISGCLDSRQECGIAGLIRSYNINMPVTNTMISVLETRYWNIPFMLCAFGANLLTFPSLQIGAVNTIKAILAVPLENPVYRQVKAHWHDQVEAIRLHLKKYFYENDMEAYHILLKEILSMSENDDLPVIISADSFNRNAIEQFNFNIEITHYQPSNLYNTLRFLTSLAVIGATATGLWNFREIACAGAEAIYEMTGIPYNRIPCPVLGWSSFASMTAMSIAVMYPTCNSLFDAAFGGGRHRGVDVLTPGWKAFQMIMTIAISLLSGAPNTLQAMMMGEQNTMLIFAYVACIFLESMGVYSLMKNYAMPRMSEERRRVDAVDNALMAISNQTPMMENMPPRFRKGLSTRFSFFQDTRTISVTNDEEAPSNTQESTPLLPAHDETHTQSWWRGASSCTIL